MHAVSTASQCLDHLTGGYPRAKMTELFGRESTGKTTLALQAIAAIQQTGGIAAFLDADHALSPVHARNLGVDSDSLLYSQPSCGEQAFGICEALLRSNAVDLIVVDSLAALVPQTELRGEIGQTASDEQVRLIETGLRRVSASLMRSRTALLFLNQIRARTPGHGLAPYTSAGGDAIKLFTALRMELFRVGHVLNDTGDVQGWRAQVRVVKNRLRPPHVRATLEFGFLRGLDHCAELLDCAAEAGLLAPQEPIDDVPEQILQLRDDLVVASFFRRAGTVEGESGRGERGRMLAALRESSDMQDRLARLLFGEGE